MSGLLAPFPDETDTAALRDFRDRYGDIHLGPVVVVIAAYNEGDTIGAVLDTIPAETCGLPVRTLVVVDGATDTTEEAAREHDAYVCVAPVNRGQGATLRLGYALAREAGAEYIVTTDADGQYDTGRIADLVKPLIAHEADFVTGSRILGGQETRDVVRRLGVHVFAWLISAFTGQRVTDTSFGFRGMRADVTAAVTLTQPQYQSSELLLGTLVKGFRVAEVPMTMRNRAAGATKKGNNLVYGLSYARVVIGTWLRERFGVGARRVTTRQARAGDDPQADQRAGVTDR